MKFIFAFIFLFSAHVFAVSDTNSLCRQYKGTDYQAQACLSIPNDWDKKVIVYNLHGLGGSANDWDKDPYYQQAMQLLKSQGFHRPLVVSISFGPWWVMKDFSFKDHPAYLNAFLEIQQGLEDELLRSRQSVHRVLIGKSLGSFNALLLLAKTNLQFERAALLCPGFAAIGPFSTQEEIQSYLVRNQPYVDQNLVFKAIGLLKMEFPTPESWSTHAPFSVVGNLKNRFTTQFYVTGNTQDEYGFGEGAKLLKSELDKLNLHVAYEVIEGHHCVMNPQHIADFLK